MANQLDLGLRAFDPNGYIAPGAKATVYQTGTSTLIDVWTDVDGSVAGANPIIADGNGYWPQRFVTQEAKVVITDADDVTLQTLDPAPTSLGSGSAASEVSFSPTVEVPFTNVQDAIQGVSASVVTGVSAFGIGITGNAPLLASLDATNIAAGVYRFDGTTTGTFPTGLVASDTGLVETWRQSANAAMMEIGATTGHRVWRRRLVAGTWGAWRDEVSVGGTLTDGDQIVRSGGEWIRVPNGYTWAAVATNGASFYDFGSIPAWASDIVCTFVNVSLATKTDASTIQIGTGGVPATSGYDGVTASVINAAASVVSFTSTSFLFGSSIDDMSGMIRLLRRTGSNEWVASGHGRRSTTGPVNALNSLAGHIGLGGSLDIVRLIRTGTGNYDGGVFAVGYR